MVIVFFVIHGLVHHEFVSEGQTVNKEYYLIVLKSSCEKMRQKQRDLWKNNSWILHDDNAPSYEATVVTKFESRNATNTIGPAPYSPGLAPCDIFLPLKLKQLF